MFMKLHKEHITLLGLTKKEARIVEFLSDTPVLASLIGNHVGLPRATLDRTLTKLYKRRLIGKHKYSARRGGWVAANFKELFNNEIGVDNKAFKIKNYIGLEEMKQAEYNFMDSYKNIKCYGVQSTRAWKAFHTRLPNDVAAELNGLLVKNKILMDIVISKEVDKNLLKVAYVDRPSLAHVIPNEFLPTAFDIEVTNKEVFIMNWENLRGISIENEEMAQMFKGLIEYIKVSSEYYNIHKVIAG